MNFLHLCLTIQDMFLVPSTVRICDGIIVLRNVGKQGREQMRIVARAGREIVYFIPVAAFSESTKKTDVSIAVAERPRWSTMAANRIYISGESVFTPANHPRVQASYKGD